MKILFQDFRNLFKNSKANFDFEPFLISQFKQAVPKLIPFFKTFCIYFILWLPEAENPSILAAVIKILPILCLCGFVIMQGVSLSAHHDYNRRILLGLIFSLFGDIFIVWEHSHFNFGVVSFGVAQLLYATAFGFELLNPLVFLALAVPSVYTYCLYLPNLQGFLIGAIGGYMLMITIMIWRAITGLQVSLRGKAWQWTKLCCCIGAVSFGISDLILGLNKFYLPIPFARAIVMVTYYGAQLGIALSSFKVNQGKIEKAQK